MRELERAVGVRAVYLALRDGARRRNAVSTVADAVPQHRPVTWTPRCMR